VRTSLWQVCGSRNTLAIDSDGQVLSWGWNARATLGHAHRCRHLLSCNALSHTAA
jgi:alpha-tubulin suppressor-like RCC1 family protein